MDSTTEPSPSRRRGSATVLGLVAAGAVAGGVLAATLTASAADSNTPAAVTVFADGRAGQPGGPHGPMGGADPMRPDEHALNATDAAKVKAAALEAVPGGTVYRVETDAGDARYEAHMTKKDGTPVTVKLNADFEVVDVQDGMGTGDPRPVDDGGSDSGTADDA
jgi:hypothetical protein